MRSLEIWSSNIGEGFDEAMATGNIDRSWATSGLKPQEQWVVPDYVVDMCPGLPDLEALNDCAELFATPDTASPKAGSSTIRPSGATPMPSASRR